MKKNHIIGIHGFSASSDRPMHNAGVVLLNKGEITFAIDEERFTRKKNEGGYPHLALQELWRSTGSLPEDTLSVFEQKAVDILMLNEYWIERQ